MYPAGARRRRKIEKTMLIKRASDVPSSEITDKKVYVNRRQFIEAAAGTAAAAAVGALGSTSFSSFWSGKPVQGMTIDQPSTQRSR